MNDETLHNDTDAIICTRLNQHSQRLDEQLHTLNQHRLHLLGSRAFRLIEHAYIRTQNRCLPQAVLAVGEQVLLGYRVVMGLKSEVQLSDIFSCYRLKTFVSIPLEQTLLADERFINDFKALYRFYQQVELSQLCTVNTQHLAIFRKAPETIHVFRWHTAGHYLDDQGETELIAPTAQMSEWHPLVLSDNGTLAIKDQLFIEFTVDQLTLKVENNTASGLTLYQQSLQDYVLSEVQIAYAQLGKLIVVKICLYPQSPWHYLVFNPYQQQVNRIDTLEQGWVQLPNEQGILFSGGYYLLNGGFQPLDAIQGMYYQTQIQAPYSDIILYCFYQPKTEQFALLAYNLLHQQIDNLIICQDYTLLDDGRLLLLPVNTEPSQVHSLQIWQTPYGDRPQPPNDSLWATIDPDEWLQVLSELYQLKRLLDEPQPSYEQLIQLSQQLIESYPWRAEPELGEVRTTVQAILTTTEGIVDELNKVQALRQQANQALLQVRQQQQQLAAQLQGHTLSACVELLQHLEQQRAQLATLKTLPYIALSQLETLEHHYQQQFEQLSQTTRAFLQQPTAFEPYYQTLDEVMQAIEQLNQTQEVSGLQQRLQTVEQQLTQLTELLNHLTVSSASTSTQILKAITAVYAQLNRTQAELDNRHQALITQETQAEYAAQLNLLEQRIISATYKADTPEKVERQLSQLLVQLDDLANRFNTSVTAITEKRTEVYQHFVAHKQTLLTQRHQQIHQIIQTATQLLTVLQRRAAELTRPEAQQRFFAADSGVLKFQELLHTLHQWGEAVRAQDLQAQLNAIQQQAQWQLQERQHRAGEMCYLGQYPFSVNNQALELTLVPYDTGLALHLTGSDFFEPLTEPELTPYRAYWQRSWCSESPQVYRGEYLAASLFFNAYELDSKDFAALFAAVQQYAEQHYQEGYEPGIHDQDAALILAQLLPLYQQAGLLRFSAQCRSIAQLFWTLTSDRQQCQRWQQTARSLQQLQLSFPGGDASCAQRLRTELAQALQSFIIPYRLDFDQAVIENAAAYLLEELKQTPLSFTTSAQAMQLARDFWRDLDARGHYHQFEEQLRALPAPEQWQLILAWLSGYTGQAPHSLLEASVLFLTGDRIEREVCSATTTVNIQGLLGRHPRIQNRNLLFQLDEFLERLHRFITLEVPNFHAYQNIRQRIIEREQQRLRLTELPPPVLTTFVRNQLIDEVYLPLIGKNFAKQMSTFTRALLLIAPSGYGKTTLMAYIAQQLGLSFVSIDCALLGKSTTHLTTHSDVVGQQELEKLNFAFALGHNVLLYLNGIEHCHPEFLQKFVSLSRQRQIEGVWQAQARHYDLRGKRFILVMAAHSTTVQLPASLRPYLDSYHLTELIQSHESLFALSYLENALAVHPQLSYLMTWMPAERVQLIRYVQGEAIAHDSFQMPEAILAECCSLLEKLIQVGAVLLKINQHYLNSANQDQQYRLEPAFKLSGSYHNMNQIAPQIAALMTPEEVDQLIFAHYAHQAHTLLNYEINILKLKEIMDILTPEQAHRWAEIKSTFRRLQTLGEGDPVTQLIRQISVLGEHLARIQQCLTQLPTATDELPQLIKALSELRFDVSIINKIPSGLEEVLTKNITIIDNTLLPIVREFERKSKLDLFIFERVKEISEILKELAASGEQKMRKHYKPLSLKRDE